MKISKKDAIIKLLRACAPTGTEPMTFSTAGKRLRNIWKKWEKNANLRKVFSSHLEFVT